MINKINKMINKIYKMMRKFNKLCDSGKSGYHNKLNQVIITLGIGLLVQLSFETAYFFNDKGNMFLSSLFMVGGYIILFIIINDWYNYKIKK